MKFRQLTPALLMTIVISMVACSLIVDPPGRPTYCEPNEENACGHGYICVPSGSNYVCRAIECETNDDCAGEYFCLNGTCIEGQCETNDDCEDGFLCADHLCIDGQCNVSDDCELGHYCEDNLCVRGCDGPERCPEGQICYEELCRIPRVEICNGIDDDFDGEIDEDLNNDGDAYSSCETVSRPPDCNDNDPDVYPGRPEECDGADNDCNGYIDDDACPENEVCVLNADGGECVPRVPDPCENDLMCEDSAAPYCNTTTGRCEPPANRGEACFRDDQCQVGTCVRTDGLGRSGSYCVELCCHSDDCSDGTWCVNNGTGIRVCAPDAWFPTRNVSCGLFDCETCFTYNFGVTQLCRPSCCGDDDCVSPGRCHMVNGKTSLASGIALLACNAWSINYDRYDRCPEDSPDLCDSGLYWNRDSECRCASPCCSDSDCRVDGHDNALCIASSAGWSQCYDPDQLGALGSGAIGDDCTPGSGLTECASGTCHPERYCTVPCCPSSPCTDGMVCRPTPVSGGRYVNLCTNPTSP